MRSFIKTILPLSFLLINIVCVTSPNILGFGRKSKRTEEAENMRAVANCEDQLFTVFRKPTPLDNFLHIFLNLNEETFSEDEAFTELKQGYYYDLLHTFIKKIKLPKLMTPQQYCTVYYEKDVNNCAHEIAEIGCEPNSNGMFCIDHLYRHWKKKQEIPIRHVFGTENLNDEMLEQAYFRGLEKTNTINFSDLPDEILIQDYYQETGKTYYLSDEELLNKYQYYLNCRKSADDAMTLNEFRERQARGHYEDDIKRVRFRAYGLQDVSYAQVVQEYIQRQRHPKYYGNRYAMYLYNEIEACDGRKLKNFSDYCKKYVSHSMKN